MTNIRHRFSFFAQSASGGEAFSRPSRGRFDDFTVTHTKSPVIQAEDYYPFGLVASSYRRENSLTNRWKFQGQEHVDDLNLGWDSFKWRNHQPEIGRFFNVDPLAEDYFYNSPYAFSENKVIVHIELEGLESVYIFDQENRPQDNGTAGTSYTAEVYVVHDNGEVAGPYSGSSYPNSVSNSNNSTNHNTVNEGTHNYSNEFGHDGGSKPGLNLGQGDVDTHDKRNVPGTTPDGGKTDVVYANVHEGTSDKGNATSRGSTACMTIKPSDSKAFFSNFNMSGSYNGHSGNTGNSKGTVTIYRGESDASKASKAIIEYKQNNSYQLPAVQSDATRVNYQIPIF